MRYKIWLITLVVMLSYSEIILSQPQRRPSPQQAYQILQDRINTESNPDSVIEYYTEYAIRVFRMQPDTLLSTIRKIEDINGLSVEKRKAHINLLKTYFYQRPEPDSAIQYSKSAFLLFEQLGEDKKLPGILNTRSQIYRMKNEYLKAEDALIEAVQIAENNEELAHPNEINILLTGLAKLYMAVGAADIALEKYFQMLETETSTNEECSLRLSISNAYKRNKNYDEAKSYLEPCLNNQNISFQIRAAILRSFGDLEKLQGNLEGRLLYVQKAVDLNISNGYNDITSSYFLAESYYDLEKFTKSDSVLSLISDRELMRVQPFTRVNIKILEANLLKTVKEYDDALQSLDEALRYMPNVGEIPLKTDIFKLQAEIYDKIGNPKKAYEILKASQESEEFIRERGKIQEEAMNKVRFQMRAKNQELAQVTTELGSVKTRNAIIVILLLMAASYIIYRYRIHFLLQEERTRNKIASDLHDDLSATLSSISFFSEAAKKQSESVDSDSKFLDRIDESAIEAKEKINDIIWAIDPENDDWAVFLTKCKRYAAEMFESKDIAYTIEIDEKMDINLDIKKRHELWMIFKELVTNLVRHSEASKAKVEIKDSKNTLNLIVEDNGRGFNPDITQDGNGVKNIKNRVDSFGKNSTVTLISEEEKGTSWNIIIVK